MIKIIITYRLKSKKILLIIKTIAATISMSMATNKIITSINKMIDRI